MLNFVAKAYVMAIYCTILHNLYFIAISEQEIKAKLCQMQVWVAELCLFIYVGTYIRIQTKLAMSANLIIWIV